jgi:hypothetical protein
MRELAGLRAGVYEKYAKYFVNAIREASIGEEETTCAMQARTPTPYSRLISQMTSRTYYFN